MVYPLENKRFARPAIRERPLAHWLLGMLAAWLETRRNNRDYRLTMAMLMEMSGSRLEDLGLNRLDLEDAVRQHVTAKARRRAPTGEKCPEASACTI